MESGSLIEEIKLRLCALESDVVELQHLVKELEEMKEIEESPESPNHRITESPVKRIDGRLISDLRKVIGLNDRIRFQKELFGGDAALMNSTIDALNSSASLDEALEYIGANFKWDEDNDTVKYFKEILTRKAY
ncbi:MAG: hypothetical protein MJ009_07540 [Paludibacteraceae bacterium]|nr:hypothetical protein [Paludibacteraceae bacterium]